MGIVDQAREWLPNNGMHLTALRAAGDAEAVRRTKERDLPGWTRKLDQASGFRVFFRAWNSWKSSR